MSGPVRRRAAAWLAGLVATGLLAGCSSAQDRYCGALAEEQKTLTDLADRSGTPGADVLTPSLASLERLRAAAPDDLTDEWDTVVQAWQALADAVEQAGVDPAEYRPGQRPPGVSKAAADRLAEVASKLSSPRVEEAARGIEQHASQVCHVDFGA